MKKLNRKGFTLVELLAVIILLALVIGITIPVVLDTINKSKNRAMGVSVEAAQRWIEDQAVLVNTDITSADSTFKGDSILMGIASADSAGSAETLSGDAVIKALGINPNDVTEITVQAMGSGRACVRINLIPTTSQYYTTEYWKVGNDAKTAGPKEGKTDIKNTSSHCK